LRAALVLFVLWFGLAARAEDAPELLLIAPAGKLKERVAADLQALGFRVHYERAPVAGSPPEQREPSPGAGCTLQLEPSAELVHVSLYTVEQGTREERFSSAAPLSVEALAVRIAEFARAALLHDARVAPVERAASAVQQSAPVAVAPAQRTLAPVRVVPAPAPPATPKATLEVGFAALGSPGGLGAGYGLSLAAGGFLTRALRLAVSAFAPLSAQSHATSAGSSESRVTLIAADLRGEFRAQLRLRPSLGCGLAAAIISTQGHGAAPDYADAGGRSASAGAYLRAGAAYHIRPSFAVRFDLTLGAQLSRFALTYAGHEGAYWGVPWFMGALGVEFGVL
jgi:hypothetical protein